MYQTECIKTNGGHLEHKFTNLRVYLFIYFIYYLFFYFIFLFLKGGHHHVLKNLHFIVWPAGSAKVALKAKIDWFSIQEEALDHYELLWRQLQSM